MAKAEIDLCELCDKPLGAYYKGLPQRINPKNGLCIEIGYSLGGWGYRQNHIVFSGEVCTDCYDQIMPTVVAMQEALVLCREPNHPTSRRDKMVQLIKGTTNA